MAAFGTMPTQRLKLLLLLVLFSGVFAVVSQISDLRKCADKTCTATLSRATVVARYPASNPLHLSLHRGDVVEIKSKSAGTRPDLWGGEVNGRRGYFPKAYVKEFDVKIDNPVFDVATEENIWSKQPPSHHQQQQQQQPRQQQDQSIKQAAPAESAAPAADETIKDDTEIDETDLTEMDDDSTDQMLQDTPKEEEPVQMENAEPADSAAEDKKDTAKEEEQARLKDKLLQDIEALQRSLKDDAPMDPQVFNDFLAKQFGSDSAASASAPSTPDGGEDTAEPGQDPTAQDTETPKAPEADQTDLEEDGTPSPAPDKDKQATDDTGVERKEEKKEETESPYINGVVIMEGGDEEEEEEVPKEKAAETEDKASGEKPEVVTKPEEKEASEDKAEITKQAKDKETEHKEADSGDSKKEEDDVSNKADTTDPTEEEDKNKEVERILSESHEAPDSAPPLKVTPKLSSGDNQVQPESRPSEQDAKQIGKDDAVKQEEKKLAVPTDHVDVPEKPQDTAQVDSTREKRPDAPLEGGTKAAEPSQDSVSTDPTETTEETAESVKKDGADKQEQPAVQEKEKVKDADEKQSKDGDSPVVDAKTADSLPKASVKETVDQRAKDIPVKSDDGELNEGRKKPEIQPDKPVSQPPPPSTSASVYQPVDIEFVAGQTKDSGVVLDSSQPPAEQPVPTVTPALHDDAHPSLQKEETMAKTAADEKPKLSPQPASKETTLIDGTRFYLENGEIADIVPESVQADEASDSVLPEVETSPAPVLATQEKDIHPTATPVLSDTLPQTDAPVPQAEPQTQNKTKEAAPESLTEKQPDPNINDKLPQKVPVEEYQTSADIVGRKVLSVNAQTAPKVDGSRDVPPAEPDKKQTPEQVGSTQGAPASASNQAPAEEKQPPPAMNNPSVTIEGEEPSGSATDEDKPSSTHKEPSVTAADKEAADTPRDKKEDEPSPAKADTEKQHEEPPKQEPDVDKTAPVMESPGKESESASAPPPGDSWVTKLSSDADTEAGGDNGKPASPQAQAVEEDSSKEGGTAAQAQSAGTPETATPPSSDAAAWENVPPPPAEEQTATEEDKQSMDEPTLEKDPYQMDDFYGRKITDEELSKRDEEAAGYGTGGSSVGSLEAQSRAFIEKLPPSIQSLLEQEPLGLSPGMTVMVTVTAFVVFLSVTCFSCLCSSGSKKTGIKSPKEVVGDLEEKLLIAVKEKENLEDLLKEYQTENKRMKTEVTDVQSKSGSVSTDLQNVKLHNEVLKNQVSTLQTEVSELQDKLSRKSDDVKTKDKKSKDVEKEMKKLQDAKQKLEQNVQKKEAECQRLEDENENQKTAIQNLTDQVQQLDTSKLQLLLEADDWKEKVDELKERVDQVDQENRQAQETISFKDSEIEVMRDCYLQLKAFQKGDGEGEEEDDFETADNSKEIQEKIQTMMDVSKVNATLRAVQEEKDNLENRLKIENDARKESEEQLQCVRREMESSMADKMKAERQCLEAQTKLNVLSSYFKDKELQLQRELGEQEALKKQNLSRLDNADENTRSLQKELEMNKQQVASLKRELTASERDFRAQIAANEKKAHENWLNARAAERELKETKHEAAVLRQKLTDLERRQMDLIRPLPTRGMPPPGMLNGPPPPGMERSPSRGSMPPGPVPPGPPPPVFREGEFPLSPRERERLPPSHPARHMPPPDARSPPPRMLPPDSRGSPPRMFPPEARSPPPYDRRGPPLPPHPMDSRSPGARLPPPDMAPPLRGPLPPRMGPPMGSPGPRMDSPRDSRQGPPYGRQPPPVGDGRRHQSQV